MAKFGKALLTTLGCVTVLVVGAYIFHARLLRVGFNALLSGDITVVRVEGVQLKFTHAEIAEMELSVGAGQQLVIAGIEIDYVMRGLFSVPLVQNLTVASARLTNPSPEEISAPDPLSPPDENSAVQQTALLLSELLQQLRDFPLERLDLNELEMPQFRQKLALHVQQQADSLDIRLATGALQLLAGFSQARLDAAAQFELSLQAGEVVLAALDMALLPDASGYQLTGNGNISVPDANTTFAEYLTTPLPVSDLAVEWDMAAEVSDDLLSDPTGVITLGIAPASAFTLDADVVANLGELSVMFPERAELRLRPGADMSISGQIPLQLTGSWKQQALQSALTLTPADCHISGALACNIGFDGAASLAAFVIAGAAPTAVTTLNTLEFAGNGIVQLDDDLVEVSFTPGARLSSGNITAPAFGIASVNVVSDAALMINISLADSQLGITGDQVSATLNEFKSGEYSASGDVALRTINLTSAEKLTGELNLQTAGFSVSGPQWLPTVGLDAALNIDGDVFTLSTPLLLQNPTADAQLQATGSYDFASGAGQFNLQLPALTLTGEGNSLSSFLNGWPFEADVMTGTLALDLDVELQPGAVKADTASIETAIKASTKIVFMDVAGFYVENFFRGLNATIDATYDSSVSGLPVTIPHSTLTIDELNVGLPITDVALDYQLNAKSQLVNVHSIFAKALDGTVSGMDISYDFSKPVNEFTLNFAGLRLERMMELAEYEGIEASGAVSGELPITVNEGRIEVGAGKLFAEAPGGSIRYVDAPPAGQGNPAMDLVNQALSNYQFQSLESTIDYAPDGELLLGMQLRGRNPDMNGGQAINLNLNISDNIPTLLKSLQAGRVIEDFLQEQYK